MNEDHLLQAAYQAFDSENAADPNTVTIDGQERPKELVFAERLTEEVMALDPDASLALRLAARCQHICRWQIPRDSEPMGRAGYLKWRQQLKKFHASKAGKILGEVGAPDDVVTTVQELNLKKNLKTDPDCQTLEDALCILFLKYQFDHLIENTDEVKMVRILQKTWNKMSPAGQKKAAQLDYSEQAASMLEKALS